MSFKETHLRSCIYNFFPLDNAVSDSDSESNLSLDECCASDIVVKISKQDATHQKLAYRYFSKLHFLIREFLMCTTGANRFGSIVRIHKCDPCVLGPVVQQSMYNLFCEQVIQVDIDHNFLCGQLIQIDLDQLDKNKSTKMERAKMFCLSNKNGAPDYLDIFTLDRSYSYLSAVLI